MNYFGIYHAKEMKPVAAVCDAPCISKGGAMLCAYGAASENRLMAMVYGRLRNRCELADALGMSRESADAALILNAYLRWGTAYPRHAEGAHVSCVMDIENDRMVLARDRMGEQPVFYVNARDGSLVFTDHPDSLLKTACAQPVVDAVGLCEVFGLGPAHTPNRTPYREIHRLESGCMLLGEAGHISVMRYFSLKEAPHTDDERETARHTRVLLEAAVDEVMPYAPAVMLSGGLDSTALTALIRQRTDGIRSFSVDYRDNEADFRPSDFRPSMDAPFIQMASEAFGTRHTTFVLEHAALAESLSDAVTARGLPGMADIDSSMLLFGRNIAKETRFVVSGECGDEVFGGYPWFRQPFDPTAQSFPWSGSVALRESVLRPEVRRKLNLRCYVRDCFSDAIARTGIRGDFTDREVWLKCMQVICFRYFMQNLQERALRMCGSANVTVLTPLCDDRLVQYVYNVPWKMKFMNGMEKGLFRAAVADIMPEALNRRKKSPYPKTCSPIYTEILRGMTEAMLEDRSSPILEWIDAERVRAIASSALNPADTPWYGQLMAGPQMLAYLWQVNEWMRNRGIRVSL